ncbi:hypothetical protein AB0F17_11795 [Nonomuraea sp. NPDC026600]|uniref:hypothetical protein n=1 Tax=Nonomuraea sp. NPDC026600 TaxID=3155363 RepID=UPI0033E21090
MTVSFDLAGPYLDRVRLGGLLLLRRVGVMVRDSRWMTVPGRLLRADSRAGGTSLWVRHGSDFGWRGTATVAGDSLTFTFDGRAERDFERARIGLCLIHPSHLAGTPVEVNGLAAGEFPQRVSPHQVFTGVRTMRYRDGAALVTIELAGETFETEDHRNWSDAGYKTYGTPLGPGLPVAVRRGDRVQQHLHLTVTLPRLVRGRNGAMARLPSPQPPPGGPLLFAEPHSQREQPPEGILPPVGLYLRRPPVDGRELAVASFLHGTVDLDEPGWREVAGRFSAAAEAAGATLTLSAVCSSPAQVAALRDVPGLGTLLVFDRRYGTPRELAAAARRACHGTPIRIGGGSRAHFAELNRAESLPSDLLDLVCFPIAAQTHHDDEASARESLAVHPLLVRQAAEHGLPVHVGPIGLLPVFGFAAPRGPHDPAPSAIFRTAWTAAALATLATAGATTISVDACDATSPSPCGHDTTATAGTSRDPAETSASNHHTGMWHVLAALRPFAGGRLVDAGLPAGLVGLAVHQDGRQLVLAVALEGGGPVRIDTRGHTITTITGDGAAGGTVVQEHPPGTETTALTAPSVAILTSPAGLPPRGHAPPPGIPAGPRPPSGGTN